MAKKENPDFVFPRHILRQLEECSNGFILHFINERGEIVTVPGFNSQTCALSLLSYSQKYAEALNQLEIHGLMNSISETAEEQEMFEDLDFNDEDDSED